MGIPLSTSPGFLHSVRTFADNLLATLKDRVELVSAELQEEKLRLIQDMVWIGAAIFAAALALTFASLTVVYVFWDTARLAVLVGLTVVYSAGLVAIIIVFRRRLARRPRPFAATLEEINADRTCIRTEN